jgi:hypothetical protein
MNTKYGLLILILFTVLILVACSPNTDGVSGAELADVGSTGDSVEETITAELEPERTGPNSTADEKESIAESNPNSDPVVEPTEPPTAGADTSNQPEEQSHLSCENPFEGVNMRFRTAGWETDFCKHSVPLNEFLSGGPPRDGIPPIDEPEFVPVEEVDYWLEDREPVIALEMNGEVRAYPLQILIWHEIVNDTIAGVPVVVTFCPLCNTALVFERPEIDGELLTFGTSGNLRNSDLVMWDRQTESWWQQFTGEAVVGELTGIQLKFLATSIISWADYKEKYPTSQVLSRDTGYNRSYGSNPYEGYDDVNQFPYLFDGPVDERLLPMTRVLGVALDGQAAAYEYDFLIEEQVIQASLGEKPIVVFWKAGTASAVDSRAISEGRDVGTTGVFLRTLDGQVLTFSPKQNGTFKDAETGSTWDILGEAIAGPMKGKTLTALPHHDTFWFAWAAFVPDAQLVR